MSGSAGPENILTADTRMLRDPRRVVSYDPKSAAALLGGNAADARKLVKDAVASGRVDARAMATAFLRREPLPSVRPQSLLSIDDRGAIQCMTSQPDGPYSGDIFAKALLRGSDRDDIHHTVLARWAQAIGVSISFAVKGTSTPRVQERREEVLRRLHAEIASGALPRTKKEWQRALTLLDSELFPEKMRASTFKVFWKKQQIVKLTR